MTVAEVSRFPRTLAPHYSCYQQCCGQGHLARVGSDHSGPRVPGLQVFFIKTHIGGRCRLGFINTLLKEDQRPKACGETVFRFKLLSKTTAPICTLLNIRKQNLLLLSGFYRLGQMKEFFCFSFFVPLLKRKQLLLCKPERFSLVPS